jgi:hypothetical protein
MALNKNIYILKYELYNMKFIFIISAGISYLFIIIYFHIQFI